MMLRASIRSSVIPSLWQRPWNTLRDLCPSRLLLYFALLRFGDSNDKATLGGVGIHVAREWLASRKMPLFSTIRGQTHQADLAVRIPPGMETNANSVSNTTIVRIPNGKDGLWTYVYCPAKPGSGRVGDANSPFYIDNSAGQSVQFTAYNLKFPWDRSTYCDLVPQKSGEFRANIWRSQSCSVCDDQCTVRTIDICAIHCLLKGEIPGVDARNRAKSPCIIERRGFRPRKS